MGIRSLQRMCPCTTMSLGRETMTYQALAKIVSLVNLIQIKGPLQVSPWLLGRSSPIGQPMKLMSSVKIHQAWLSISPLSTLSPTGTQSTLYRGRKDLMVALKKKIACNLLTFPISTIINHSSRMGQLVSVWARASAGPWRCLRRIRQRLGLTTKYNTWTQYLRRWKTQRS